MDKEEFSKALKQFHKVSERHVLVIETDMSYCDVQKVVRFANRERIAGNELTRIMEKNYEQLIRSKKYQKLLKLYNKAREKQDETTRKKIGKQLNEMQEQHNVTWSFCEKKMQEVRLKYNVDSIFALTTAQNVWCGVERCLYGEGEKLHFSKYGASTSIRAKQTNRGIVFKVVDNTLRFKFKDIEFGIKIKDRFHTDEVNAILEYLANPEIIDARAVELYQRESVCMDTYRPCYATLVTENIRGKDRVFLHITIEGKAKPKYDKNGNLRRTYGEGTIGADIGTQTVAYTSNTEVGLKNLSERGRTILENERMERILYRAMDRSRRATNPDNYNEDGTIKKGKKEWKYSKNYKKKRAKHRDLCRVNARNRELAINEDANHIRSLGDVFVTEEKNASKLQKRAKKTTVNEKGKINRKKRFGKSIQNRCPGKFQATIESKFRVTGGKYIEVPTNYRASQYDHTANDYIKKKLSDRMYQLSDGTTVQRDWYSSFLLYCYNPYTNDIDKQKCKELFQKFYPKELAMIEEIIKNKIKVLNSGIKIASN